MNQPPNQKRRQIWADTPVPKTTSTCPAIEGVLSLMATDEKQPSRLFERSTVTAARIVLGQHGWITRRTATPSQLTTALWAAKAFHKEPTNG